MARIACDMDEVIADTYAAEVQWLREARGCALTPADLAGKKPRDAVAAADAAALEAVLCQGDFFAAFELLPGAAEVLARLAAAHTLYIATAAMDYPRSCLAKFTWLRRHLPFVPADQIVFCGNKQIVRADFLIDDSPRHFAHFEGHALLFDAPHNRAERRYERLTGWKQVAARLL